MRDTSEIRGETIARIVLPVGQFFGELACKMNDTGVQPPIDPEIINELKDLNSNNGQDAITSDNEIDVLRPWALSLVFDLINTEDEGALEEYIELVGVDSPQARFMKHMADHHSANPGVQDDIAERVSSVQITNKPTKSITDPRFPDIKGIGAVAFGMNAVGIQPLIEPEIVKDLTNQLREEQADNDGIDINLVRVIAVVKIFGLLENPSKLAEFVDNVGADSPQARFMKHMAEHYAPGPVAEHALLDRIQV